MMGPGGFEPPTNQLCVPLQLSLPLSSLWSGLSHYPDGYLPSSLYTFTPILGRLARDYPTAMGVGFPEFDRFSYGIPSTEALCALPYPALPPDVGKPP